MKKMKDNNQKLYKIRIYKDFEFPSFSIDQKDKLKNLYEKSIDEIKENLYLSEDEKYFELEVIHILPFEFREELKRVDTKKTTYNYNFLIREIAINDLEVKYGKLDFETNPIIFDKRTKNNGETGYNFPCSLKADVEEFYSERVKHYCTVLENKMI